MPKTSPLNLERNNIHEAALIQCDREGDWLKERGNGIGGSQVAAIMNECPWDTPTNLYAKMIGATSDDVEVTDAMELGNAFEKPILDIFSKRTDLKILHFQNSIFHRKDNPVHRFSPDALCLEEQKLIEAKYVPYTGKKWGEENSDQAPPHILLQVLWGLHVLGKGWNEGRIPAVLGGKYAIFNVERQDELIGAMVEAVNTFWAHVLRGREEDGYVPAFATDGRPETSKAMLQLYGEVRGDVEIIEQPSVELMEAVNEYPTVCDQIKELTANKNFYAETIKKGIGEKPGIIVADRQFTWSRFPQTRVDSKRLKADMPEVFEVFSKTSMSSRLTHKAV